MKELLIFMIVFFLGACSSSSGGSSTDEGSEEESSGRTVTVAPYKVQSGAIATSYLKFKADAPTNEALIPYLVGTTDGKYVDDVLDDSAIIFDVDVPNDAQLYGSYAGTKVKYVGVLYYQTQADSSYVAPSGVEGWEIPSDSTQMESAKDSAPIFKESAKTPLIIYSHGGGGQLLASGYMMNKFATNGYIVLGLFHGDQRFVPYSPQSTPEEISLRTLSISKAIDFMQSSKYSSNIDFDKIGAIGNSFGGTTTFMLAGAKPVDAQSKTGGVLNNVVSEPRVKVGVGIEPFMGNDSGNFEEIQGKLVTLFGWGSSGAASVSTPYIAITGSSDTVAVPRHTESALAQVPKDVHLVSMEGESHEITPEGSATAETWGFYFLNYYLKDDKTFLTMKDVKGNPVDTYNIP